MHFAFFQSFCRGRLSKPSVLQLDAVFDEMVTEGLQHFSRKLLHEDVGSNVLTTTLLRFAAQFLMLLGIGIMRLVCFSACYSLTLFSSQENFANNNKKGWMEWDGMGWLTRISKMGQQSGQPSTTAWRVRQSCSHLPLSRSVINDYLYLYISHSTTKLCFHSLSFFVVVKFLISLQ